MRLIDENGKDIIEKDCDLTIGEIIETDYVAPEAYDTIDNVTKFALNPEDFERVRMYRLYTDMDYQLIESNKKNQEREEMLSDLPDTLSTIDDALCFMYEMMIGE